MAKANVGGTAERNHLSNIVTANSQHYTSWQGSMLDSFIEAGQSNIEWSCFFMQMTIWFLMALMVNLIPTLSS